MTSLGSDVQRRVAAFRFAALECVRGNIAAIGGLVANPVVWVSCRSRVTVLLRLLLLPSKTLLRFLRCQGCKGLRNGLDRKVEARV